MIKNKRPKGVIICAVALLIAGFFSLIFFLPSYLFVHYARIHPESWLAQGMPFQTMRSPWFAIQSALGMIIMLGWIVSGFGLFKLKEWARKLGVGIMLLYLLNIIPTFYNQQSMLSEILKEIPIEQRDTLVHLQKKGQYLGFILIFTFSMPMILYLTRPKIKEQFR